MTNTDHSHDLLNLNADELLRTNSFLSANHSGIAPLVKRVVPALAVLVSDVVVSLSVMMAVTIGINFFRSTFFGQADVSAPLGTFVGLTTLLILLLAFRGQYWRENWGVGEIGAVVGASTLMAIGHALLMSIDGQLDLILLVIWPVIAFTVLGARMAVRGLTAVTNAMTTDILIIGSGARVSEFNYQERGATAERLNAIAQVDLGHLVASDGSLNEPRLDEYVRASVSNTPVSLLLAPAPQERVAVRTLITRLNAIGCRYLLDSDYDGLARQVCLRSTVGSDRLVMDVRHSRQVGIGRAIKRISDLAMVCVVLVLLSPVYLLVAGMLFFENGPIFFKQTRIGRGGARFDCFKFRTMRPDAQERLKELLENDPEAAREWAKHQKLENDPRITKLGHLLRQTSLDELPQIFNVMTGDMSFVGPRPIIAPEIEGYSSDYGYYHSSDFVHYKACSPGITGLWQVSGRAKTTHDERVRLDRWYAENWSWKLDLLILFKTFCAVFGRSGT